MYSYGASCNFSWSRSGARFNIDIDLHCKLVQMYLYEASWNCCRSSSWARFDVDLDVNRGWCTSLLPTVFVNLKFFLWVSPSFRSSDFSNALQPKSRRDSAQCLGQWNLMEAHSDGVDGAQMATDRRNNSLMTLWYSPNSVFKTGARTLLCTITHNSKAFATSRRCTGEKYSAVVHRHTCSCRIIEMYHPPSMRLKFKRYSVMPWRNSFKPLRSPISTLPFCAGEPATNIINASMRRQTYWGITP